MACRQTRLPGRTDPQPSCSGVSYCAFPMLLNPSPTEPCRCLTTAELLFLQTRSCHAAASPVRGPCGNACCPRGGSGRRCSGRSAGHQVATAVLRRPYRRPPTHLQLPQHQHAFAACSDRHSGGDAGTGVLLLLLGVHVLRAHVCAILHRCRHPLGAYKFCCRLPRLVDIEAQPCVHCALQNAELRKCWLVYLPQLAEAAAGSRHLAVAIASGRLLGMLLQAAAELHECGGSAVDQQVGVKAMRLCVRLANTRVRGCLEWAV